MEKQHNFDSFVQKYSRPHLPASRQLVQMVLGHDLGRNGYTTLEQAQLLCDSLGLQKESYLLEIGGGDGWPGVHLAETSGCTFISSDIPFPALCAAQATIDARGLGARAKVVAADGRALPFQPGSFDVLVHADVF